MTQLDLFTPAIDWSEPVTCEACGLTTRRYMHFIGHTIIPGDKYGDCMNRRLRRNHVASFARAIATAGEWPGRPGSGRKRGWTPEQGRASLAVAVRLAKESGVTDAEIDAILAAEGVAA